MTFTRSAELDWQGDVPRGSGKIRATTGAFDVGATYPSVRGDPPGATTPEELLAASHAVCFGIGVRSVIGRQGGTASRIHATATITTDKGPDGIRIRSSHVRAVISGLEGIAHERLGEIGALVERGCTISTAIRENVAISYELIAQ